MGFRTDRRIGLAALLAAFANSFNATATGKDKIVQISRARPATFTPPTLYVGLFAEPLIVHREGVRTRAARDQLVLVQGQYDNAETADRQDLLVDAFMDWLTDNPSAAGTNTVTEYVSSEDVDLDLGGVHYFATIITVTSDIAEGRN